MDAAHLQSLIAERALIDGARVRKKKAESTGCHTGGLRKHRIKTPPNLNETGIPGLVFCVIFTIVYNYVILFIKGG